MLRHFTKGKVCVFIDAANLESSVKSLNWWVDYSKIRDYIQQECGTVAIRHYCPRLNDKRQDNFFTFLKHLGIKLITKPLKVITKADEFKGDIRKANFDVEMALDARDLMDEYDTLVLFSGDSDFDYLVKLLRRAGKRVIVISTKHHVSRELIASCNKYLELKKLRLYIERVEKQNSQPGKNKSPSFTTGS